MEKSAQGGVIRDIHRRIPSFRALRDSYIFRTPYPFPAQMIVLERRKNAFIEGTLPVFSYQEDFVSRKKLCTPWTDHDLLHYRSSVDHLDPI